MNVVMLPGSVSRLSGGLFTSVRRLSHSLEDSRIAKITVIGHADEYSVEDLPQWSPLTPRLLHRSGGILRAVELVSALREIRPQIVHRHFLWSYGTIAASRYQRQQTHGCQFVVSPRGMLDPWAIGHRRWKKRIAGFLYENKSLAAAACLHALNASEAKSMRAYGLKNPICIIPNGIDLPDPFSQSPVSEQVPGEQNNRPRRLLFLGRIHSKKGLEPFLKGWALSLNKTKDWRLIVAGWDDGGYESALRRLVSELKLESQVTFVGPQHGDEKANLLRSCDAFVLPSFSEGLPMSVLEAWAYRLPVLMTEQCNLPVGFTAGAAIPMEPTPESAAEGLSRLTNLSDRERTEMGEKGYRLVEQDFTWRSISQNMLAVYQWILGNGSQPSCVTLN